MGSSTSPSFTLIALFILSNVHAQVPPCTGPLPDHVYGTYGLDNVSDVAIANDGKIFVVGSIAENGGNVGTTRYGGRDALVLKLEPSGELIWSAVLGGTGDDVLREVVPDTDGGCIAMGVKDIGRGWRLRLGPTGDLLWNWEPLANDGIFEVGPSTMLLNSNTLIELNAGGAFSNGDLPTHPDVIVGSRRRSPDGGFIAARTLTAFDVTSIWSSGPPYLGTGDDIGLVKTDASGNLLWAKRLQSVSVDGLVDYLVLPDGYLLLSSSFGSTTGGDRLSPIYGLHDFWVIKTDLDGNVVWERSYGSSQDDIPKGMIQDTDGNFVLYGRTEATNDNDVTEPVRSTTVTGLDGWMLKIDDAGNKLWDKRWGGGGADWLYGCVPVPGGYLVIGTTESDPGYDRTATRLSSTDIWAMPMLPGTPSTWYNDADADGFGDPASPITACTRPFGYAANGLDCDPLAPNPMGNFIGARCDDGFLLTFPDLIDENCVCDGDIPDFLLDNLDFHLFPDGFAGALSMSVFRAGEPNAILNFGPWPNAQPGVAITEQFQLPPGEYTMRVFDAQADGILNGGYSLTVNGKRIIEANGAFQQSSGVAQGFELPIGRVQLTQSTCGRVDLLPSSIIIASPDAMVSDLYDRTDPNTGYQFWLFDPHGGYSRRIYLSHRDPGVGAPPGPTACAYLKLSSMVTNPVPQLVMLNVRIRPRINGVYGPFGPACTLKVDPYAQACPTTKLVDQPSNPNFSCGVQRNFGGSGKVVAYPVAGATSYQFEFAQPEEGYVRRIVSSKGSQLLNWITLQPLCGTFTYQVRVRISFNGGQSWCPWGVACPVTIVHFGPGCTQPQNRSASFQRSASAMEDGPTLSVFPNPAEGGALNIRLSGLPEEASLARYHLLDAQGRVALEGGIPVMAGGGSMVLGPIDQLTPGMYAVLVTSNAFVLTERVVIR